MWTSKTRQFEPSEIGMIETMPVESLVGALLNSAPIVALRVMAEVMLHEDGRLEKLLNNAPLTAHWRRASSLLPDDSIDGGYARQLEAKILELQQKGE